MSYGIKSRAENIEKVEVSGLFKTCKKLGINYVDTATSYGEAEKLIGANASNMPNLNVITKLTSEECLSSDSIRSAINETLIRTGQSKLHGVLLHDPRILHDSRFTHLKKSINKILDDDLVDRFGFSSYTVDDLLLAKKLIPDLSIFQIPENVCDRRNYNNELLFEFSELGNQIFIRSIFLQGLLLMDLKNIPGKVERSLPSLQLLNSYCEQNSVSVASLCISYAKSIKWACGIVVGVDSAKQLDDFMEEYRDKTIHDFDGVPKLDEWTLDPRNWS